MSFFGGLKKVVKRSLNPKEAFKESLDPSRAYNNSLAPLTGVYDGEYIDGKPESKSLAHNYASADWRDFVNTARPIIEGQMASLDDTKLVDDAQNLSLAASTNAAKGTEMAMQRRGIKVSEPVKQHMAKNRELNDAVSLATSVNNARLDQQDRNLNVLQQLASMGADVRGLGMDNLRQSEGLASERRIGDRQRKDAAQQQNVQTGATILTTAAMMF